MTIQLSPTLEKRIAREAKARGMKPKELAEQILKAYFKPQAAARPETAARRELRARLRNKEITTDSDRKLHAARAYARQMEEDNAHFIERAAQRYTKRVKAPQL